MKQFKGNLLDSDVDVMVHVCNLYHTFGSGIAYYIRKKYPNVYQADLDTEYDCESKLGTFSKDWIEDNRLIYNLYAMYGIGNDGSPLHRNLSYDHFYNGLYRICCDVKDTFKLIPIVIGVPKYIGCCRAGGSWDIVESILKDIESQYEGIEFHVYELENGEMVAQSTNPQNNQKNECKVNNTIECDDWVDEFSGLC
jgi:hypothetical protein